MPEGVRRSVDESPEYVLPISFVNTVTYHIDAVMARDYAWFETLLQKQRGFVQQEKEVLLELMQRVLEVKNGKMAVYAMIVEELARKFSVRIV